VAQTLGGTGPTLPFTFDSAGEFPLESNHDLIIGALTLLFNTSPGQMPMDKDFGHTLLSILFLNWNQTVKTMTEQLVGQVVSAFEDRIRVIDIEAERSEAVDEIICKVVWQSRIDGSQGTSEITLGG